MGPAEGSDAAAGRVARPGAGGVVPRAGLFERLGASARVTVLSAPPGSGKTVLLHSWITEAGLADRAAWVSVGRDARDPQRFWVSVAGALRQTTPGSALVRPLTAGPDLDGWAVVERLLKDLAPLELRRAEPGRLVALHGAAAGWYAGHGYPVEAVRHAQAAEDWALAARLLSDHWTGLSFRGRGATTDELLAGFPIGAVAADPELTVARAASEMVRGSAEEAGRQLALAASALASVPPDRRERVQVLLAVLRDRAGRGGPGRAGLPRACQRGDAHRRGGAAAGPRRPAGGGR